MGRRRYCVKECDTPRGAVKVQMLHESAERSRSVARHARVH
jgi:hypothetical protein